MQRQFTGVPVSLNHTLNTRKEFKWNHFKRSDWETHILSIHLRTVFPSESKILTQITGLSMNYF